MKELRDSDRAALVKLLADDDERVQELLQEQLLGWGADGVAFLQGVVEAAANPRAVRGARQMLQAIRERGAVTAFAQFCGTCGEQFDLENGCWLLARTRYPELPVPAYTARLDQLARELRERLTGSETPLATIEVCNHHLFQTLGFRGNHEDYHDPDNSYLNRVLDRRLGIPISLSAMYLMLARRLRLPLIGINMPGHFLLKWQSADAAFYVDAFNAGQALDESQCREFCRKHGFSTEILREPATPRQILLRMGRNLHGIYRETDPARAEHFGRFVALLSHD